MKYIGIIPARYASTRFPAKPLAILGGKTVIERVYKQVKDTVDYAAVATDDQRIYDTVIAFGGNAIMTSTDCKSGTDRCWQAFSQIENSENSESSEIKNSENSESSENPSTIIINIQGDEPFIQPQQIESLKQCFDDPTVDIATLVKPFTPTDGLAALENPNSPKVVVNRKMEAMYFSRSVIPYLRGKEREQWLSLHTYYKHIGLYAYRANILKEITQLPQSTLELAESLEQLRWLENGYKIKVGRTDIETIGIDTPADLERAEQFLKAKTI
ncbi:MAG: 3-deoxy-manno-octulosonate cytidylyltransferase [Bacteroidaceae bacterium]|nr:3-deoxy-manno-octulosonate cytidylyltransferase [Bacteroidaceae bacterium]MBQ9176208.1 3-deoxy-manno-octulosonate cytidylyltransferase [Bacteroidaceae bacterium]